MALPWSRGDMEKQKFVETSEGDVAIRTKLADFDGDINVNVESNSVNTGGLVGKPSGTNGDFTTAYAAATQFTCSSLPTGTSSITNKDIVSVAQINSSGVVVKTFFRDDETITCSGTDPTTVTVAGATFGATDSFVVYTNIERIQDKINVSQIGGDDVAAANTARTTATKVLATQPIDASGNVLGMTAANTARTTSTLVTPVQLVDAGGKVGDNVAVYGEIYASPHDFTATYTSSTTVTITGASFTVDDSACYVMKIDYKPSGGSWVALRNANNGVSITASAGVITVSGAGTPFASGDTYRVMIGYQRKAFDSTLDVNKSVEQSPLNQQYVADSLLDTTNIAAATNYYPSSTGMSMDGYKNMSLSGKFIDADGTMTLTVEAMNDEDTTNGDWVQVYGYDTKNNVVATSWTVTNGTLTFAVDFDNLNYSYYRIKMVNDGATNTGIIKMRRSAL